MNDLELAVGRVLNTFPFIVVCGQSCCDEKALLRREPVLLVVGTLDRVTDDCDLGDVVHDHDFRVQEDGGDHDEHDGDKGAHVALIGATRPFKVNLQCRLAYGELVVGSELASNFTKKSSHAICV